MSLRQFILFIFYLTIISAFTGTLVMSVEVGPIHLFPYRFLLIFMWLLFVVSVFMNNGLLNLSHVKVRLYLKFLTIWLGYAFVSMMWAADKNAAVKNCIFLFTGISIVFFLVYYLRDIKHLKWLYWLWLLMFMALIPVGLWEVITGNHLVMSNLLEEDRLLLKFVPTTVFTNQNDYATYIALTLPMVLVWIRYYPKLYSRVLGVLVFTTGLFLLLMTTSRASYIAFFMGVAFWFIFLLNLKKKIKTLAIVGSICILAILALPEQIKYSLEIVESEMSSLSDFGSQAGYGGSETIRPNLIKNALYFTIKSAGFGVGAGNAEYYMENYKIYPVSFVTNVHNWWIEILVNYGVFIFAGYVFLYLTLLLNLWRVYKTGLNLTERMLCEALLVGLVSFFMASISSSSIVALSPQWIFCGFVLAFLNYIRLRNRTKYKCIS